jgi:ribosomal protein S18 acetylase RimI-like enzyme
MVNNPTISLTIREATVKDAVLIAEISHETFYETFAPLNTTENMEKFLNHQFTKGKLITEVGMPDNTFFLAYNGKEVVGYVKLRDASVPVPLKNKKALEIARIYSVSSMIGKGVGKLLMETSIQFARKKQKELVWLGVWEQNRRAIEFYAKWGFQNFGETDFLLGDDIQKDYLMLKYI